MKKVIIILIIIATIGSVSYYYYYNKIYLPSLIPTLEEVREEFDMSNASWVGDKITTTGGEAPVIIYRYNIIMTDA